MRDTLWGVVAAVCAAGAEVMTDGVDSDVLSDGFSDVLSARGVLRGRLSACCASSMDIGS